MKNSENSEKRPTESLCWNCKRCTGDPNYPCSWAQKGEPIKGWLAEEGRAYNVTRSYMVNGQLYKEKVKERAYLVIKCPLYMKDKQFFCLSDVIETVAKVNGVNVNSVHKYKHKKFKNYEKLTGEKIPPWAWDNQ